MRSTKRTIARATLVSATCLVLAVATHPAASAQSEGQAQATDTVTQAPTPPMTTQAQPAPQPEADGTAEDTALATVSLDHPVTVSDALSVADAAPVRELRYDVDGASGGVFVQPGATPTAVQVELDKATTPHGFQPPITAVVIEVAAPTPSEQSDESQPSPAEPSARRALPETSAPTDEQAASEQIKAALARKPLATAKGTPQQPTLGVAPEETSPSGMTARALQEDEVGATWRPH